VAPLSAQKKQPDFYKVVYFGCAGAGKRTNLDGARTLLGASDQAVPTDQAISCVRINPNGNFAKPVDLYAANHPIGSPLLQPLLKDLHGVIFVADSALEQFDNNMAAMAELISRLSNYRIRIDTFPSIIQYNKRDLADGTSIQKFEDELNPLGMPAFNAIARDGEGVVACIEAVNLMIKKYLKAP